MAAPSAFLDTWTAVSAELVACARRWAQAWDGVLLRKQVERLNRSCISLPFFPSDVNLFFLHFSLFLQTLQCQTKSRFVKKAGGC